MFNAFAALCFGGLVLLAIVLLAGREAVPPERRKLRVSLFLVYALGASFGAGLTQLDLWPFSAWPLVAGLLPPAVTQPRLVGVDADGVEYQIDARAYEPLSFDELMSFMDLKFLSLDSTSREQVARDLLARANAARLRALRGERIGEFGRWLGPLSAPLFLLHPTPWNDAARAPARPLVRLRFYRDVWRLEERARDGRRGFRRLVYESRELS
jgi:hypothetical protein